MINALRKPRVEIEEAPPAPPRPEEAGKTWAIEARGITKSFKAGQMKVEVLKGIDLLIEPGEIVLVMGPSGSGKSTLLAAVSGLMKPDGGSVIALDQNIWKMARSKIDRSGSPIAASSSRASTCSRRSPPASRSRSFSSS